MASRRRRGRGEGSIYRKGNLWCAALTVGHGANGRLRRRTLYARTRKDVADKLARLKAELLDGGLPADPGRLRTGEYLSRWLEDTARLRVRPSTLSLYRDLIRLHVLPRIGGVPFRVLSPPHLAALLSDMERDGASPRLRQQVYAVLHTALRDSVRAGLLPRNPAAAVDRPRAPRPELRALDSEQVNRLLKVAEGNRLEALYAVAVGSGLRLGELLGLRWGDVDLDEGAVRVCRTLTEQAHTGKLAFQEPKTARSRRRVELPGFAVQALRGHRGKLGAVPHPERLVFTDTGGKPIRRSNLHRRNFKPLLRTAGLPDIPFHSLRHTAASLALALGTHPKVVQEMLGHASISLTLDTYSHTIPSMGREAADRLDALIGARS